MGFVEYHENGHLVLPGSFVGHYVDVDEGLRASELYPPGIATMVCPNCGARNRVRPIASGFPRCPTCTLSMVMRSLSGQRGDVAGANWPQPESMMSPPPSQLTSARSAATLRRIVERRLGSVRRETGWNVSR